MTKHRDHRIDWREQFDSLERFLATDGGVIQILAGAAAPASTFAKALRSEMARRDRPMAWTSVQLDANNPNTHYLEDIAVQLTSSMGLRQETPSSLFGTINVGTGNTADVIEVSDVNITYDEDDYSRSLRMTKRLEQLRDDLANTLTERRVGLVFLDSHRYDRRELARLRSRLWDPLLSDLTSRGLLLIDIADPLHHDPEIWPPPPDLAMDLPDQLVGTARAHALEDLVRLALQGSLFSTEPEAAAFATTLLATSTSVADVHAGFARAVARIPKVSGSTEVL